MNWKQRVERATKEGFTAEDRKLAEGWETGPTGFLPENHKLFWTDLKFNAAVQGNFPWRALRLLQDIEEMLERGVH